MVLQDHFLYMVDILDKMMHDNFANTDYSDLRHAFTSTPNDESTPSLPGLSTRRARALGRLLRAASSGAIYSSVREWSGLGVSGLKLDDMDLKQLATNAQLASGVGGSAGNAVDEPHELDLGDAAASILNSRVIFAGF